MSVQLEAKLKTAMDETRLLILGAQVLFGFQFEAAFQELYRELPDYAKGVHGLGVVFLVITLTLLIAPSLYHQIACGGETRGSAVRAATVFAGFSLLPLTLGLGASAFVALDRIFDARLATVWSIGFVATGIALFYGLGFALRSTGTKDMPEERQTPLSTKVEQLLTEARVIIPGAQALLGFQLIATLTKPFESLPTSWQHLHAFGLSAAALSVLLLMTPAALHRIAFRGEDNPRFLTIGSGFVIAAAFPLAVGVATNVAFVFYRATQNDGVALLMGSLSLGLLLGCWYGFPLLQRARVAGQSSHRKPLPSRHG